MGLIPCPPGLWHARNQATARRLNKGESPSSAAHCVAAVQREVQSPVRLFRGEMMRPRHVMIMVAGGMLAGMVAPIAPARAENPMTPVRPAEPEKTANPTTAPAGRPAAVPATRSTAREPAAAIPTIAPPSGDAGIASVAARAATGRAAARRSRPRQRRDQDRSMGVQRPPADAGKRLVAGVGRRGASPSRRHADNLHHLHRTR